MNLAHIRSLDLNLLVVAAALYRHSNVSAAARELGLTQSAVSHALKRLRIQFKDPLFVRTAHGIAPTRYACSIQSELLDLMGRMERLARREAGFNPREATGRITIASQDYFEAAIMGPLLKSLAEEAPRLQISLRPTQGELPKRALEEGSFDLAVAGFYRDLPEGFYQSKLFMDDYRCAVGEGHPLFLAKKLSREEYFAARHALITLQGDFLERTFSGGRLARKRDVVYGSYSFTGMAWVLQDSGLLLTAPGQLIESYRKYFPMRVWDSPVERKSINVRMVWHAQTHEDPLRAWFRTKLKSLCSQLPALNS